MLTNYFSNMKKQGQTRQICIMCYKNFKYDKIFFSCEKCIATTASGKGIGTFYSSCEILLSCYTK